MEMFKVDDNDIQGRLEFNKEWWSAAQEGEPMAGDEIREVRWLIELAGKQHEENERLRKELEEKQQSISDIHHHAESLYQIIQRGDLNTVDLTQADAEYECLCKIIKALGQEGEGNQEQNKNGPSKGTVSDS